MLLYHGTTYEVTPTNNREIQATIRFQDLKQKKVFKHATVNTLAFLTNERSISYKITICQCRVVVTSGFCGISLTTCLSTIMARYICTQFSFSHVLRLLQQSIRLPSRHLLHSVVGFNCATQRLPVICRFPAMQLAEHIKDNWHPSDYTACVPVYTYSDQCRGPKATARPKKE